MPKFDASTASCHVFSFKEGALSALAHDLELRVRKFTIEVAADLAVTATFDATSLEVMHAVRDGQPRDALSDGDKRKIEKNLAEDVLDSRRYPEIRFRSTSVAPAGDGYAIAGELVLHGKTRTIEATSRKTERGQLVEITLHQPDYGIKPFSAMLGTLKIKPDVRVRVTLPWPATAT